VIYRPSWINAFEFAVLAARRAEQLRRGCVARVEGGHKLIVTAQLEVIAGKVVRVAERTVQDLPKAIGPTESPAAFRDQEPATLTLRARTAALTPAGLAAATMAPSDPMTRGKVS
jgi:DNA-directed RNA polymerase subunit K/omega